MPTAEIGCVPRSSERNAKMLDKCQDTECQEAMYCKNLQQQPTAPETHGEEPSRAFVSYTSLQGRPPRTTLLLPQDGDRQPWMDVEQ